MARSFEQQGPWGDVPRIPEGMGGERPQEDLAVQRKVSYPQEAHGDVPRLPEELRETPELMEKGALWEAVRVAGTAESLAQFRMAFEDKISKEQVPVEQWQRAAQKFFSQYPEIRPYEDVLQRSVEELVKAYTLVQEGWRNAQERAGVTGSQQKIAPGTTADERTAKELFMSSFGERPHGKVQADLGLTAIFFTLEEKDLKKVNSGRASFGFARTGNGPPYVIAVRSDRSRYGMLETIKHEREHVRNAVFRSARDAARVRFGLGLRQLSPEIGKRLEGWSKKTTPMEERAKDELLAQFVVLDADEENEKTENEASKRDSFVLKLHRDLTDRKGAYRHQYEEIFRPSKEEVDRYLRSINAGMASYRTLHELYKGYGDVSEPNRMARYVLEQFPLHRWPAAVRLLEMHHREHEAAR